MGIASTQRTVHSIFFLSLMEEDIMIYCILLVPVQEKKTEHETRSKSV